MSIPSAGKPNTTRKNTSVSGVLRSRVTYPAPVRRSAGTGDTRIAASRVPSASDRTPESRSNCSVVRNPRLKRSQLSTRTSTSGPSGGGPRAAQRRRPGVRWARSPPPRRRRGARVRSVALERRRLGGRAGLAEGGVVDLLPLAAAGAGGEQVVHLVPQRLVVLGEPDAVLLLGER